MAQLHIKLLSLNKEVPIIIHWSYVITPVSYLVVCGLWLAFPLTHKIKSPNAQLHHLSMIKYTQQKKLRKLCLPAYDKDLKHLKTFEFHNDIMCQFFFILTHYLGT